MKVPRSAPAASPETRQRYRAALQRLFERRRFGLAPGLEVTEALLGALDHPERTFPAVHVTGSKGKGSVATIVAAILAEHGRTTALYTSPHLASYRERMRVNGRMPTIDEVVDGLDRVEAAAARLERSGRIDRPPTFFEVTTALAFDWFRRSHVEAAVVEVGLGGRLDATNVLDAKVGVITTIELEHTDILGDTVEAIAGEKAGIFHTGMTTVVGELPPTALTTVQRAADRYALPLWRLGRELRVESRELLADGQKLSVRLPSGRVDELVVPLLGTFQAGNTALAVAAASRFLEAVGSSLDPEATRRALAHVSVSGRLERTLRSPELFLDVAHTPESARAVAKSVAEVAPLADPSGSVIVFGSLQGKRVDAILDALAPLARTIVLVPVRSERALSVGALRPSAAARFPRVVIARSAEEGLSLARAATAPDGITLVVGSDYLVGELLRGPEAADEPDLSDPGRSAPPSGAAAPTARRAGRSGTA
jgi:dihydrofolate synthase/folylpolyglutamate synthase